MKKVRRAARELALNILYQSDAAGVPFDEAVDTAMEFADLSEFDAKGAKGSDEIRAYARELVTGIRERIKELDRRVALYSKGWPLDRQPFVDRNILRIALYEIAYSDTVPPLVAIDEAVEIAKKYSTAESGRFINGILASYIKDHTTTNDTQQA
jgi:transcription antitermination protein NusB